MINQADQMRGNFVHSFQSYRRSPVFGAATNKISTRKPLEPLEPLEPLTR